MTESIRALSPVDKNQVPVEQVPHALSEAELLLAISTRLSLTHTLHEGVSAIIAIAKTEIDAELGSLFFNDPITKELFFFPTESDSSQIIRIPNTSGIAGHVFHTGRPEIIDDPYADPRFNRSVDVETGVVTRNILCVPLTSARGEIIGVAELINKRAGNFTESEKARFAQMVLIGALSLKGVHFPELRNETRAKLAHFVEPLKRSNET